MIINDLNHLVSVSEETAVVGGRGRSYRKPSAEAYADAWADAIGRNTTSATFTEATAVAGAFSSSTSSSYARAEGYSY